MTDFFRNLVKDMKDEDTSLLSDGKAAAEFSGFVDTGSYMLNAALSGSLYGGVPNNKIGGLAGEEATGKTFFLLAIIKNFLDNNPDGGVVYFDTESAVTNEMMQERGIDTNRVIISEPMTVQDFRNKALAFLAAYDKQDEKPPMMYALDSLGNLSTMKELEDAEAGKDVRDMTRAQLLKGVFRVLTLKLAKRKIPMICTNHVYAVIGNNYASKEMGGGGGLKYAASWIAFLSKAMDKDQTTKEVYGNYITVKMEKSRHSKEKSVVKVKLSYKSGLDRYSGLRDLAEKYGIFKKLSRQYELPDGRKVFGKFIDENPEEVYTEEIMAKLEEAAQKEFNYGNNFVEDDENGIEREVGENSMSEE